MDISKAVEMRVNMRDNRVIMAYNGAVSDELMVTLAELLKRCELDVKGKGPFKEEFVTAGGVPLDEIDLKTMESRRVPRFYVTGEALDVDAVTGGFNFQNAWSTGWAAGQALRSL